METKSKKGATSSHTIAAKGGCLKHNRREQKAANVVPKRTYLNESWESDKIKNLKTLTSLKKRAAKLYTEKQHQKCQKTFAPFKESCVVVKEITTLEEAKMFAESVEELTGIKCVGIWLHKDEGYYRSVFSEGDNEFKCNYHVHFLWYCQNENTGKAIPIKREELRKMQDLAAKAFKMERGNSASLTKRSHIQSMRFKMQQEEERLSKLLEDIKTAESTIEPKKNEIQTLNMQKEDIQDQIELLKLHLKKIREQESKLSKIIEPLEQRAKIIQYAKFSDIQTYTENSKRYITCRINGEQQNGILMSDIDAFGFQFSNKKETELQKYAEKYFNNVAEKMGYKIKM